MYNVFLADDEAIFREYLRNIIPWEQYGMRICGEARNGAEAYEAILRLKPDICLLDINMPLMDGLELTARIKEQLTEVHTVLVTGYREFEYAKRAMKLDASDYIVKPFDENEMITTLMNIKGKLQRSAQEKNAALLLQKEKLLNSLIERGQNCPTEPLIKEFSRLGIQFGSRSFSIALIEAQAARPAVPQDEKETPQYVLTNFLQEMVKTEGHHFIFKGHEGKLVSMTELEDRPDAWEKLLKAYERICHAVGNYYGLTVTIGVGNPARQLDNIPQAYQEALAGLRSKVLVGKGGVITYGSVDRDFSHKGFYSSEVSRRLLECLRLRNTEGISVELDRVFKEIVTQRLSVDCALGVMMGLVSVGMSYIIQSGKSIEEVLGNAYSPLQLISSEPDLKTARERLLELFLTIAGHTVSEQKRSDKIILDIVDYIDRHYPEEQLSVKSIADSLYFHPDYIRKLFKKKMDIGVTEYILEERMQKAKALLAENPSLRLKDLGCMVGFSDVSYFSKCFKKFFGVTPSLYDASLRNK